MLIQSNDENYDFYFKIALAGEQSVGKTCIISKYISGKVSKNTQPTIGVEFFSKMILLKDGQKVKAQIWDTSGQERYRSITSNHFRKSVGALIVFDLTKEKTFLKSDQWIDNIKDQADPDVVIILIGNKLDVVRNDPLSRKVSLEQAQEYAQKKKVKYIEVSAETGENLSYCFELLFQEICKQKSGYRGGEQSTLRILKQASEQNQQCKC